MIALVMFVYIAFPPWLVRSRQQDLVESFFFRFMHSTWTHPPLPRSPPWKTLLQTTTAAPRSTTGATTPPPSWEPPPVSPTGSWRRRRMATLRRGPPSTKGSGRFSRCSTGTGYWFSRLTRINNLVCTTTWSKTCHSFKNSMVTSPRLSLFTLISTPISPARVNSVPKTLPNKNDSFFYLSMNPKWLVFVVSVVEVEELWW